MRNPRLLLAAIAVAGLVSGCDGNNHGNPVPPAFVNPTASPTPGVTATPTPVGAPPGSSILSFCSLTNNSLASNQYPPVPGTYTVVVDEGELTGTSYAPALGEYEPVVLTSPSPGPTLAPTPTPTPTAINSAPPSYVYYVYEGGYAVPGYVQTPGPSAPPGSTSVDVDATTGCFLFIQEIAPTPAPAPSQSPINAFAEGIPFDIFSNEQGNVGATYTGTIGTIPTFGFTSLSPSTGGSGTFTLDNGLIGTFTVSGQQVFTEDALRRAQKFVHNRFRKT